MTRFEFDMTAYMETGGDWFKWYGLWTAIEQSDYYHNGSIEYSYHGLRVHIEAYTEEAELWLMMNLPDHTKRVD